MTQIPTTQMSPILHNLLSSPMFKMAQSMAQGKAEPELKQIALNICKEKGLDIEAAYQDFQVFMKSLKGA